MALAQECLVVSVSCVQLFRIVAVRRVLSLPLSRETLPPVSCQQELTQLTGKEEWVLTSFNDMMRLQ